MATEAAPHLEPRPTAEPADATRPRVDAQRKPPEPYIVVVGLDLSEPGGRAWRFAFDLAKRRGEAEIHAVIIGARGMDPGVRDIATPRVSTTSAPEVASNLPPLKVLQHQSAGGDARLMAMHYRTGRADREIVRLAQELGADLIVIPTQRTSRFQRWLGGSTADRIARSAPCPVVVVRPKQNDEDPGVVEYEPRHVSR